MKKYQRPIVQLIDNCSESIYMASGINTVDNGFGCNSKYMNGVYHAPDYTNTSSYIERFGCNGCPAFRQNGCGLQIEQYWESYDVDNGRRMPNWEKIGHSPNDPINWSDVGLC